MARYGPLFEQVCVAAQSCSQPTICDTLELEKPDWLRGGVSLLPLIEGTADSVRDFAFSEVTYHAGYEPMRSIRTASHSLIRIFEDDLSPVPA